MYIEKLPNAAASVLTVTSTATSLFALIETAAGSDPSLTGKLNALDITPEDGDIRVLFDGNTPTAANGLLLKEGSTYFFRGVPLSKMSLIRTSGDVSCSIQVGQSELSENTNATGSTNVTIAGEDIDLDIEGPVAHDAVVSGNPVLVGYEAADFDGAALPNNVAEGDVARGKVTLHGVQYVTTVNADGSSVSAGASSTSAQYRATTNGNGDGTVVYASAATLTVSGTPFTIQNEDLVYVREVDATGNTAEIWVNGSGGVHMEISAGTLTKSGGSDFSANGEYELGYNGQDKAYTAATQSNRAEEIDPITSHHVEETLADVTNETSGTNYYYLDMDGYKYFGLQINTGGTAPTDTLTITIEASLQDDGTAPASCFYEDVTNELFGVASWVDTDLTVFQDTPIGAKYVRVKTVTAGGSNDQDYAIYSKRF